jgi:hypothetical protein
MFRCNKPNAIPIKDFKGSSLTWEEDEEVEFKVYKLEERI